LLPPVLVVVPSYARGMFMFPDCLSRPLILVVLLLSTSIVLSPKALALTARNSPALAGDDLDCEVVVPLTDGTTTTQSICECEQLLLSAIDSNPFFPEGPMVTLQFRGLCREGVINTGAYGTKYCYDHCGCDIYNTNPWNPTNWYPYWVDFMIEGNGP
jgi:hypothetical protein